MLQLLYIVLALPIFAAQSYSGSKDISWLVLALISLGLGLFLVRQLSLKLSLPWLRNSVFSLLCVGIGFFQFARLTSFYFQGESFNTRFFFHFEVNSLSAAWKAYPMLSAISLMFFILTGLLAYHTINRTSSNKTIFNNSKPELALLLCSFFLLGLIEPDVLSYSQYKYRQLKGATPVLLDSSALADMGLNEHIIVPPDNTIESGKNLLLIYLESLEGIYTDENSFEALTPNFTAWQKSGLNFTNMHQTPGTEFTMGGIVSSQCGTPLLFEIDINNNDIMQNGLLNSMPCIGDILATAGYKQVFLGGASTQFAGKGRFLLGHQYDEVLGKEELIPQLSKPGFYKGWGLYDESIFEFATDKYFELADSGAPFNLTVLTLDTHHPVGRPSPSCPKYAQIDNSILHAVHCSDFLVKEFIDSIKDHPAYENTLVVFFSDHYAMRNDAEKYYPKSGGRRLLFTILNAEETGEIDKYGVHMDVAPTILSLLNIDHGAEFLTGENILASTHAPGTRDKIWWEDDRLDTIRYINSNLFTSPSLRLCQNGELIRKEGRQIKLAGKTIVLSAFGQLLPENALSSSHAFLSFWGSRGFVDRSLVLQNASIVNRLSSNHESNFLLIAKPGALPSYLKEKISNLEAEVVALIGSLDGEVIELQLNNPGGDFTSQTSDCDNLFSKIETSKNSTDKTIWKEISKLIQQEEVGLPQIGNSSNIDFSETLKRFLPKGFWTAESFGRWTSKTESSLTFIAAGDFCNNSYLALKIDRFYDSVNPDSFAVYLNDSLLNEVDLDQNSGGVMHYFDCSDINTEPGSVISLAMKIDKVVSPSSLQKSTDKRTLGFAIINLAFVNKSTVSL